jgi:hypothetical protein
MAETRYPHVTLGEGENYYQEHDRALTSTPRETRSLRLGS